MLLLANLQREELNPWLDRNRHERLPEPERALGAIFFATRSSNPRSPPSQNTAAATYEFVGELKERRSRMF